MEFLPTLLILNALEVCSNDIYKTHLQEKLLGGSRCQCICGVGAFQYMWWGRMKLNDFSKGNPCKGVFYYLEKVIQLFFDKYSLSGKRKKNPIDLKYTYQVLTKMFVSLNLNGYCLYSREDL